MPTFSRLQLLQLLTTDYLRDGVSSTASATGVYPAGTQGFQLTDQYQADPSLTGQNLYQRGWIYHQGMELRVASFNVGSGAYISQQYTGTTVASGGAYLFSQLLPISDKSRCIDDVVKRIRVLQEVGIATLDGNHLYTINGAASPHYIEQVLDCYYFANPSGSLSRGLSRVNNWEIVLTATGRELRIDPALAQSQQIIMNAILAITLGAADTATINIPDDRWVLSGAAAKAYDLLIRRTPGQSRGQYAADRKEFATTYSRLSQSFQPQIARTMQGLLGDPDAWTNNTEGGWDW